MAAATTPDPPATTTLLELAIACGYTVADQRWRSRARCAGADPETFAIARGQSPEDAYAYCERCDVTLECLDYALSLGQQAFGVWGHTTGRQRRDAKRRGWNAAQLLAEIDG
jgi:hypothetical protein